MSELDKSRESTAFKDAYTTFVNERLGERLKKSIPSNLDQDGAIKQAKAKLQAQVDEHFRIINSDLPFDLEQAEGEFLQRLAELDYAIGPKLPQSSMATSAAPLASTLSDAVRDPKLSAVGSPPTDVRSGPVSPPETLPQGSAPTADLWASEVALKKARHLQVLDTIAASHQQTCQATFSNSNPAKSGEVLGNIHANYESAKLLIEDLYQRSDFSSKDITLIDEHLEKLNGMLTSYIQSEKINTQQASSQLKDNANAFPVPTPPAPPLSPNTTPQSSYSQLSSTLKPALKKPGAATGQPKPDKKKVRFAEDVVTGDFKSPLKTVVGETPRASATPKPTVPTPKPPEAKPATASNWTQAQIARLANDIAKIKISNVTLEPHEIKLVIDHLKNVAYKNVSDFVALEPKAQTKAVSDAFQALQEKELQHWEHEHNRSMGIR